MIGELETIELWEIAPTPDNIGRGFAAISWSPHTFHLSLWIVLSDRKPLVYGTRLPTKVVERWQGSELPTLSEDCLDKLSALEAARGGARG